MSTLQTFDKQPSEVQDYDVDFSQWLAALADTAVSATVTADTGITINSFAVNTGYGLVKVWASGGTDGNKYKVTVRLTTSAGRLKEADITIRVREL